MRGGSERRSVASSSPKHLSVGYAVGNHHTKEKDDPPLPLSGPGAGIAPHPPPAAAAASGWWLLLPMIVFFQIFLLYRWSLVSSMVVSDHRLLHRKSRDVAQLQQALQDKSSLLGDPDALVRALVGNVSQRLEAREVELVGLGLKLLEREKELTRLHDQLVDFLSTPRATAAAAAGRGASIVLGEDGQLSEAARAAGSAGGMQAGGEEPVVPAPPVPTSCKRQQDVGRKGKVQWHPTEGRYLLVMCNGGQLSNRISCMRQHMLDAALLNRTLVLPSHGVDYNYDNLLDMTSPKTCFGEKSFMTLDEYAEKVKPTKVRGRTKPAIMFVDAFVCHVHAYQTKKVCATLVPQYEALGIRFSKPIVPDFHTPSPWYKYKSAEFISKFSYPDAQVVAFGNMFGVGGADHRFRGSAPLAVSEQCRYYLMPSKPIMDTAAGFINTFLGSRYISLHLRRGDFYDHCVIKGNSAKPCYHPLNQVAKCIEARLRENPGVRMLYLSTNGDDMEVKVLRELLTSAKGRPGGSVSVVRMPLLESQSWAEPLISLGLHKDREVVSLVEKTISVMSAVFYGTAGSTYTGDINRLRDWLFTRSCADANICPDDQPADTRKSLT